MFWSFPTAPAKSLFVLPFSPPSITGANGFQIDQVLNMGPVSIIVQPVLDVIAVSGHLKTK